MRKFESLKQENIDLKRRLSVLEARKHLTMMTVAMKAMKADSDS